METPQALIEYGAAALAITLMAFLLRWTFGTQNSRTIPSDDPDDPMGTGLLAEVSRVPSEAAAAVLRGKLAGQGIRATVSREDAGGYRLLVFPDDLVDAKVVLSRHAQE